VKLREAGHGEIQKPNIVAVVQFHMDRVLANLGDLPCFWGQKHPIKTLPTVEQNDTQRGIP